MITEWESQEERLLKFMKIAPKKKLEWLHQMHDFLRKALTKKQRYIYHRLRENR
jgi:hypothetical protein